MRHLISSSIAVVTVFSILGGGILCGATPHETAHWVGANYTPAYAVNQVQFWHDFRPEVIDKELAAAKKYFGITTLRVYLHNIPYDAEKETFLDRIEQFLVICNRHGIRPGFTFFDDCHRHEGIFLEEPTEPVKGYHNGRWAACPQDRERTEENLPKFKAYIQDVIRPHHNDPRVLWWEIFNEPNMRLEYSRNLRTLGYAWAKEIEPTQPVICCWDDSPETDIVDARRNSRLPRTDRPFPASRPSRTTPRVSRSETGSRHAEN